MTFSSANGSKLAAGAALGAILLAVALRAPYRHIWPVVIAGATAGPAGCTTCPCMSPACAMGLACAAGTCKVVCGGGGSYCTNVCVNLQSDSKNCGACGKACTAGYYCSAGTCR